MPTYENLIQVRETSLAIESMLVAPQGTTFSPTRINISSPPAGFSFLGAVVEESPQLQVTRERYQLRTGIPQVLQYQAVRGVSGTFQIGFIGNSNRLAHYALGHNAIVKTTVGTYANAVQVLSIDNGKTRIFVGTTAAASFVAGDWLTAGASASEFSTGDVECDVFSVGDSPGWLTFTSPGFLRALSASDKVGKIVMTQVAFGTKLTPFYHVIGVADFIDGVQVIHDMQKAAPTGEWTETLRPDGAVTVNTSWELFGYSSTTYGGSELIVGERFFIPKQ